MATCCYEPKIVEEDNVETKKSLELQTCEVGKFCYRKMPTTRFVEPFSIQAFYQPNTVVYPLPKIDVYQAVNVHSSHFRRLYLRGDFPCQKKYSRGEGRYLHWKVPPQDLDYSHYLPIMFDGLCEAEFPYKNISSFAIHDMLNAAGDKVFPIIPQIILPIKRALRTKNPQVIAATCRVIQHLCMCDSWNGDALVPYYRQLLPALNMFYGRSKNLRGDIDYHRFENLGDIIEQTLMILERCGGPCAFMNIKFAIPAYESCFNKLLDDCKKC